MIPKTFRKKEFNFLFLFLLSFLFISLVSAVPPPQTNININIGLQVEFTEIDILENSKDHLFNAHVFNISTGLRITNETTDCNFHLFNNKGIHIINQVPMSYDSTGLDFEYNATGGNFTRNGQYAYLIVCNSTNIGGFAAVDIIVTQTGLDNLFEFYIIILLISAVLIIFGFYIRDPWVVIFGTFGLYFVGLYIMINGIVGIKDMVTTWAIALILLGVAAYISIKSGVEMLNG